MDAEVQAPQVDRQRRARSVTDVTLVHIARRTTQQFAPEHLGAASHGHRERRGERRVAGDAGHVAAVAARPREPYGGFVTARGRRGIVGVGSYGRLHRGARGPAAHERVEKVRQHRDVVSQGVAVPAREGGGVHPARGEGGVERRGREGARGRPEDGRHLVLVHPLEHPLRRRGPRPHDAEPTAARHTRAEVEPEGRPARGDDVQGIAAHGAPEPRGPALRPGQSRRREHAEIVGSAFAGGGSEGAHRPVAELVGDHRAAPHVLAVGRSEQGELRAEVLPERVHRPRPEARAAEPRSPGPVPHEHRSRAAPIRALGQRHDRAGVVEELEGARRALVGDAQGARGDDIRERPRGAPHLGANRRTKRNELRLGAPRVTRHGEAPRAPRVRRPGFYHDAVCSRDAHRNVQREAPRLVRARARDHPRSPIDGQRHARGGRIGGAHVAVTFGRRHAAHARHAARPASGGDRLAALVRAAVAGVIDAVSAALGRERSHLPGARVAPHAARGARLHAASAASHVRGHRRARAGPRRTRRAGHRGPARDVELEVPRRLIESVDDDHDALAHAQGDRDARARHVVRRVVVACELGAAAPVANIEQRVEARPRGAEGVLARLGGRPREGHVFGRSAAARAAEVAARAEGGARSDALARGAPEGARAAEVGEGAVLARLAVAVGVDPVVARVGLGSHIAHARAPGAVRTALEAATAEAAPERPVGAAVTEPGDVSFAAVGGADATARGVARRVGGTPAALTAAAVGSAGASGAAWRAEAAALLAAPARDTRRGRRPRAVAVAHLGGGGAQATLRAGDTHAARVGGRVG